MDDCRLALAMLVDAATVIPIGDNIYRPLLDGFREGDDARDVLSDAIDWWERQHSAIETALKARKPNTSKRDKPLHGAPR